MNVLSSYPCTVKEIGKLSSMDIGQGPWRTYQAEIRAETIWETGCHQRAAFSATAYASVVGWQYPQYTVAIPTAHSLCPEQSPSPPRCHRALRASEPAHHLYPEQLDSSPMSPTPPTPDRSQSLFYFVPHRQAGSSIQPSVVG